MPSTKVAIQTKSVNIKFGKHTGGLLNPIVILGRCFGLLPIRIEKTKYVDNYHFEWKSFKMLYTGVVLTGAVLSTFMCFWEIIAKGLTLTRTAEMGFYANAVVTICLFGILSKNWSALMDVWTKVDISMNRDYGFPKVLHKKVMFTTAYFMFLAVVEHSLSLIFRVLDCQKFHNCTPTLYYSNTYPQIFHFVNYSIVLAIITQVNHIWCTFAWNYSNLFIMLMSTILAERFKQITERLKHYDKFKFVDSFWSTMREDYDKLCNLCYCLDASLSYIILSSYGTNLFFILTQLYNSLMNNYRNVIEKTYFFYSFGFLIFRTVAVSLYAATINDASKEPAVILHSVPSLVYNAEIKRFLFQISFDSVVLSGCRMFKITRGLILNIAGAIVTYELVLIQFNAYT